ncbi:hypothetical protein F5Y18DRAFT_142302 [Xylariaceae sp. FL1019]|nr:hypothetical protein F5Y18DRAFT_142302 [Xylariaceae sp. FL1019]
MMSFAFPGDTGTLSMSNTAAPGRQAMATSHHAPPAGRQARPRRKSLEQLEAKYKALMRNMLMYQHMRSRNVGADSRGQGNSMIQQKAQQHPVYQVQQTVTPESSVSPAGSATSLENMAKQNHLAHQHHVQSQNSHTLTPAQRQHQQQQHERERAPQKRLHNGNQGPKPVYDRRDMGGRTQQQQRRGPVAAAMQLALDELANQQDQVDPPPPPQPQSQQQHHQYPQHQHHQPSAPIPIPRPVSTQMSHHMQQPQAYMHHQPLPTPPPALDASAYRPHHSMPTITAPYAPYDAMGQSYHNPMPGYDPNATVEGNLVLDGFVPNI